MKTCVRCSRNFEADFDNLTPSEEHADAYLRHIAYPEVNELCPQCREEVGLLKILGFDEE